MKKIFGLLIVCSIIVAPSFAQSVTIDYAHDFDFSTVKTFAYVDSKETNAGDSLTHNRIRDAIIREMKEGDLQQVDSDADLYITYHVATQDRSVFNTTSYGYGGWGAGWGGYGRYGYPYYGGGMSGGTTTETVYTDGTLVIDAYEPGKKELVWRGTGTVTLKAKPEKRTKQIDNILSKMGNKWDKILKNQGK